MMNNRVLLSFKTLYSLWAFCREIDANEFEINKSQLTLSCHCDKKAIELAKEKYGAIVLETANA